MRSLFHKAQAERWGLDQPLRLSGMGAESRRWGRALLAVVVIDAIQIEGNRSDYAV